VTKLPIRSLCTAVLLATAAAAQAFPDRSVTILMPFAAGSTTDVNARDFAQVLSEVIKQPVVVDNKVGAEGIIAGQALVNASPDGHTMLYTSSSLPVLDGLMKKNLPYNAVKDFAPICSVALTSNVMDVTAGSAYKTPADVIAAAKVRPGKLTYAYSSATTRLAAELFAQSTGIKLTGIPYKSSVNALTEVSSGQVDMMFIDHVSSQPFLDGGKVRALTVAGTHRIKALPDVPSAVEAGVPGYNVKVWFGIFGPGKTTPTALAQVREAIQATLKKPEMIAALEKRGLEPMAICGDALAKFQADEIEVYRGVVKKAGIEPQ
jgi:tripartite-type tricarboxylate transporter receptor subunit TctC